MNEKTEVENKQPYEAPVLSEYGGDVKDYLAVKTLVAWQVLQIPELQQGLARAVIVALAPLLAPQ